MNGLTSRVNRTTSAEGAAPSTKILSIMCYRQNETYWCTFVLGGERGRQSLSAGGFSVYHTLKKTFHHGRLIP